MVNPKELENRVDRRPKCRGIRQVVVAALLLLVVYVSTGSPIVAISADRSSASTSLNNNIKKPKFDQVSCLKEVLRDLPVAPVRSSASQELLHRETIKVWAHHGEAETGKWNQDIRFLPVEKLESNRAAAADCSIWEVGAHMEANDSRELMKQYPLCQYHGYEPVPKFFYVLQRNWESDKRMTVHNYGLAGKNETLSMSKAALDGEATYIDGGQTTTENGSGHFKIRLKSFRFAVKQAGNKIPTVLHINCEGCEWDMLPQALDAGFLQQIEVINLGTHNYPQVEVGKRAIEYCEIRERLSETHDLVAGSRAFAWERWTKKRG